MNVFFTISNIYDTTTLNQQKAYLSIDSGLKIPVGIGVHRRVAFLASSTSSDDSESLTHIWKIVCFLIFFFLALQFLYGQFRSKLSDSIRQQIFHKLIFSDRWFQEARVKVHWQSISENRLNKTTNDFEMHPSRVYLAEVGLAPLPNVREGSFYLHSCCGDLSVDSTRPVPIITPFAKDKPLFPESLPQRLQKGFE